VLLPLRDAPDETSPEPAPASAAAPARGGDKGGGECILLADDDEVVGLTTEALLQRAGYRVTRVGSGLAAIETVREDPRAHALVITDYNMPGLSGLAVAEQIRAIAPGLPVLITSGYVTEELLDQARALGVRGVLLKEHSLERLAALIGETLAAQAA
jgi:CheY-like chemotaxis protein